MAVRRCEEAFLSSSQYELRSHNVSTLSCTRLTQTQQVFGPPPKNHPTSNLPQHGFARISKWEYLGKSSSETGPLNTKGGDDAVRLDFGLSPLGLSEEMKKAWPYDFSLQYSVTLAKDGLRTMLGVRNAGSIPFDFQMLTHTYFRVPVSATDYPFGDLPDGRLLVLVMDVKVLTVATGHLPHERHRSSRHEIHRQSPRLERA